MRHIPDNRPACRARRPRGTRGVVQMVHWTQLEIEGFSERKALSTPLKIFVGAHCRGGVGLRGGQIGADHIDAVEHGLGGDAAGVFG